METPALNFTTFFLRGLAVGFLIAAPIGPIGILIMRRSLVHGWLRGFVSGAGAAVADATYATVAAFGVTFISNFLSIHRTALHLVGGAIFCVMGVKTFFAPPYSPEDGSNGAGLVKAFAGTLALTLTNPMTLVAFAGALATLGVAEARGNYMRGVVLVLGVFIGSGLWWVILASVSSLFQGRLSSVAMRWINRVTGLLILGLAIYEIALGVIRLTQAGT